MCIPAPARWTWMVGSRSRGWTALTGRFGPIEARLSRLLAINGRVVFGCTGGRCSTWNVRAPFATLAPVAVTLNSQPNAVERPGIGCDVGTRDSVRRNSEPHANTFEQSGEEVRIPELVSRGEATFHVEHFETDRATDAEAAPELIRSAEAH